MTTTGKKCMNHSLQCSNLWKCELQSLFTKILICYMNHTGPKWPFVWYEQPPNILSNKQNSLKMCHLLFWRHVLSSSATLLKGNEFSFSCLKVLPILIPAAEGNTTLLYHTSYYFEQFRSLQNKAIMRFIPTYGFHSFSIKASHLVLVWLACLLNCEW